MKQLILFFVSALLWSFVLSDTCVTPLGVTSKCVSLLKCPQMQNLLTNRSPTHQVVSFVRRSHCGFEGVIPKVCCGPFTEHESSTPPTTRMIPASEEDSIPAPRGSCGLNTNGDRIFSGQNTEIDEFPWMALLIYRNSTGALSYQCGGVLINRRYVLTAAHCMMGAIVKDYGKLETVRLGEYNTKTIKDCLNEVCADPVQEIAVQGNYPHPGYSEININNKDDIGLIRLAKRANYSYYVQPICLPNSNTRLDDGLQVYVAGWGKRLSGTNSPVKQKLSLPIYNKTMCAKKYYRKKKAILTDNQICAGGVFAKDPCKGDSGGPLMKEDRGIMETVGVISFGIGCGMGGSPGVYTFVPNYLEWIQTTMKSSNVEAIL